MPACRPASWQAGKLWHGAKTHKREEVEAIKVAPRKEGREHARTIDDDEPNDDDDDDHAANLHLKGEPWQCGASSGCKCKVAARLVARENASDLIIMRQRIVRTGRPG